jgi:hypothetical protein
LESLAFNFQLFTFIDVEIKKIKLPLRPPCPIEFSHPAKPDLSFKRDSIGRGSSEAGGELN